MATATFDKVFIVTKSDEQKHLLNIINSDEPAPRIVKPSWYTKGNEKRGEKKLKQILFRSKN